MAAHGNRGAFAVGAQIFCHFPHGLRDNRYGDDVEPVQPCRIGRPSNTVTPYPKKTIADAEGPVKASHALSAPGKPARKMPTLIPTWLLAGPGRNWQSAAMSASAGSSSHRRRSTNSLRK